MVHMKTRFDTEATRKWPIGLYLLTATWNLFVKLRRCTVWFAEYFSAPLFDIFVAFVMCRLQIVSIEMKPKSNNFPSWFSLLA